MTQTDSIKVGADIAAPAAVFRLADNTDLDKLVELEQQIFGLEAWSLSTIRQLISRPDVEYTVAVLDSGEIVGFSLFLLEDGTCFHIGNLGVVEEQRKRGLGRLLMERMLERSRQLRASRVYLEVASHNHAARSFYKKLGFIESGLSPAYYQDGSDAVIMDYPG